MSCISFDWIFLLSVFCTKSVESYLMIHWQQFEQGFQFDPKGYVKTELPFSLWLIFVACLCHWNGSWWLVAACSKLPNLLSSAWPEDWGQVRVLWQKYQLPIDVITSPSNGVTWGFDAVLEDRTLLQMLTNGLLGHLNLENCYLVTVKHDPWIYTLDNFEIGLEIELALQEWKWVKSASQYPMKFLPSNITQQHLFETNLINKRHTFLKSPKEQCYMLRKDFLSKLWCVT